MASILSRPQFVINPKETSWGLKGPVAYRSYHCVSLENRFLLKRYVFLKNIVLRNIMCETKWIVITTTFFLTDIVVTKLHKRLKRASKARAILVHNSNKWHIYKKMP